MNEWKALRDASRRVLLQRDAGQQDGDDRRGHGSAAAEGAPALRRDRDALVGDCDGSADGRDEDAAEQEAPGRGARVGLAARVDGRAQRRDRGQEPGERHERERRQAQPLAHERDGEGRDEDQRERGAAALREQREADRGDGRRQGERARGPGQPALRADADERPESEHAQRRGRVGIARGPAHAVVDHPGVGRALGEPHAAVERDEPRGGRDQPDHGRGVALRAYREQDDRERRGVEERARGLAGSVAGQPGPEHGEAAPEGETGDAAERDQPEAAAQAHDVERQQRTGGQHGDHCPGHPVAGLRAAILRREGERGDRGQGEPGGPSQDGGTRPRQTDGCRETHATHTSGGFSARTCQWWSTGCGCARSRTSQMNCAISSWARASQRLPFSAVASVASPVTPEADSALQCGM